VNIDGLRGARQYYQKPHYVFHGHARRQTRVIRQSSRATAMSARVGTPAAKRDLDCRVRITGWQIHGHDDWPAEVALGSVSPRNRRQWSCAYKPFARSHGICAYIHLYQAQSDLLGVL
jgi:hypothetical protein